MTGQALINRWEEIKITAIKRTNMLDEKYNQASSFISDVNAAIDWLKENKFFDRMHTIHHDEVDNVNGYAKEGKTDLGLQRVQNEILMLKQLVSESKQKERLKYKI